jgi:hypothetical protein
LVLYAFKYLSILFLKVKLKRSTIDVAFGDIFLSIKNNLISYDSINFLNLVFINSLPLSHSIFTILSFTSLSKNYLKTIITESAVLFFKG